MIVPSLSEVLSLDENKEWRIGDIANILHLSQQTLRDWEKKDFPELAPRFSGGGQRVYSKKDVERCWVVKYLIYGLRFTKGGASQMLQKIVANDLSPEEVVEQFELVCSADSLGSAQSKPSVDHDAIAEELNQLRFRIEYLEESLDRSNRANEALMLEKHEESEKVEQLEQKVAELEVVQRLSTKVAFDSLLDVRQQLQSIQNWAAKF